MPYTWPTGTPYSYAKPPPGWVPLGTGTGQAINQWDPGTGPTPNPSGTPTGSPVAPPATPAPPATGPPPSGPPSTGYPPPAPIGNPSGYQPSNWFLSPTSGTPMTGGQYGFWAPLAQRVAGPSGLQSWAASAIPSLFGTPAAVGEGLGYGRNAYQNAGQVATGNSIGTNRALQAAHDTYMQSILPQILQQQTRSMGTSRSTGAQNAVAQGWGQMALPIMQNALNREQQAINQKTQTGLRLAQLFPQIGMSEAQRQQNVLGTGMQFGGIGRGISQQANNAQYQDLLRRQALWEDLWKVPMGQASTTFGRRTSQGGGLFK